MNYNKKHRVIGLMSGTSLDGIDLAYCYFFESDNGWSFKLIHSMSIQYSKYWKEKLSNLFFNKDQLELVEEEYSNFISNQINSFIKKFNLDVDCISSHGHTIFHQPKKRYTKQIGRGDIISKKTGLPVVCNFRKKDIFLGGQGAPLVPFGDHELFSSYDSCLNLGGFSNISYTKKNKLYAYDICPVNIVFNYLSNKIGCDYDKDGINTSKGNINKSLLKELNDIEYYKLSSPKSLSKEWVDDFFNPILNSYQMPICDFLRTCSEHFVFQIHNVFSELKISNCLVTGGGVFNKFFINQLGVDTDVKLIFPDKKIILFKEAIIFAFLGLLKINNRINCLSSVTGASRDHSCGELFYTQ